MLFLISILHETSSHRRNKKIPSDASTIELLSVGGEILILLTCVTFSLTPWILLLGEIGRGSSWVGSDALYVVLGPLLCRETIQAVSRDAALRCQCTFKLEIEKYMDFRYFQGWRGI